MAGKSKSVDCDARQRRIQQLEVEVQRATGRPVDLYFDPGCDENLRESFLSAVLAYETSVETTVSDALIKAGVNIKAPEEIPDGELHSELWGLLGAMALIGVHIKHSDHLSDRELYELLFRDVLHEPTVLMPDNLAFTTSVDLTSNGSKEENDAYLRYYADSSERRRWALAFPHDVIPPHQPLPYDRDSHLPRPRCACHTGDGPRTASM